MKKVVLIYLLLTSLLFGANLDWPNDYEAALQEAKKENKSVYMLITSADCRWCRKFENTTLQEEIVIHKLKEKYILLHVDRDEDDFPSKFKRERVPRHYFIKANEDVIYSFLGYWDREDFFSFLGDVDKRYQKMQ
jgi:thioredoxin-related protein